MARYQRLSRGGADDDQVMSAINTTPLVDVMLVLLIIFLITIPVVTQSIDVKLPKQSNIPTQTKPENVVLAVDKKGVTYWNVTPVSDEELAKRLMLRPRKTRSPRCISVATLPHVMVRWAASCWRCNVRASSRLPSLPNHLPTIDRCGAACLRRPMENTPWP